MASIDTEVIVDDKLRERPATEVCLSISGEFDIAAQPSFMRTIQSLTRGTIGRVVIDMKELRFVDSSGLSVLVAAQGELERRGATLVLRSPQDFVLQVLDLTDLCWVFNIEP